MSAINLAKHTASVTALTLGAVLGYASVEYALANKTHMVSEKDKLFSVKSLEVAVGDTVSFVNDDDIKHNVLITKMKFDSGLQDTGAKTDVEFTKAGKFKVRCAIHPKMKMTVVVK